MLHNGTPRAAASAPATPASNIVFGASHLDDVVLPSHLVAYRQSSPVTTTTQPASTNTSTPTVTPVQPAVVTAPAVVTTTTTTTAPLITSHSEVGIATWYAAAPPGYCASTTLPFGTVLTVVDNATGASTVCTVDDREESPYPRVVDLSPSNFSQLAPTSQGVVDVTVSW